MTLIYNARQAGESRADAWVLIENDLIKCVGHGDAPQADVMIDAAGAMIMPGVIDCHVHFRDPGLTHKADMRSESMAALAGGVTSVLDMPNTRPVTTIIDRWQEKCAIAGEKCLCNYAFFIGATSDNVDELIKADYSRIPGVKLFMGSSTGNMLVDSSDAISRIFAEVPAIVAVHAEDQCIIDAAAAKVKAAYPDGNVPVRLHSAIRGSEACYRATARAVDLARKYDHRLHICHLTTDAELLMLQSGPVKDKLVTSEVSPHHLLWCTDDYDEKGTLIKMNPAVKTAWDRDSLLKALERGLIDMVATDHAPHQLEEKQGDAFTAVSGAPMVQFSLAAMLSLVSEDVVVRSMCHAPAEVYGIEKRGRLEAGYYADIVLVREVEPYTVTDADVISKCGWTPMAGRTLRHKVEGTWVNGVRVYDGTSVDTATNAAMPLRFAK